MPLVYRDDVVDALLLAAEPGRGDRQVINVVDTTPITQNEYLGYQRAALGIKATKLPLWFLMMAGAGIEMLGRALKRGVPLSRYKIRSLKPLYPFDVTAAEKLLGWKPRVGLGEGLRRTFGGDGKIKG